MEYKIISGRTVEIRRSMMEKGRSTVKRRGLRVKGQTSLRKILANEREAVKNLARVINCNFGQGDIWVTLGYDQKHLPADKEAAKADMQKFMRKLKAQYKKQTGKDLRYIYTTSEKKSYSEEAARLHHHVVMDEVARELIYTLWPCKQDVTVRYLDGRGDYTGIAKYMIDNAGRAEGKRRYASSKGLRKPVYTEPVPVKAKEKVRIPRDCSLKANEQFQDSETGMYSLYVRFTKAVEPEGKYINLPTFEGGGRNGG